MREDGESGKHIEERPEEIDLHRDHLEGHITPFEFAGHERYLGKISDVEAMKWIDTLYA